MNTFTTPRFACDAMLGSLARWLRATGHDSFWQEGIDDWDLIRFSRKEGRILLSCDTGIFKIGIIRDGDVPNLQLANGLSTEEQLEQVVKHFGLHRRDPLCMLCSGTLQEVPKGSIRTLVPPKTFGWIQQFWQCEQCSKPFWKGSHWTTINNRLSSLFSDR